MEKLAILDGSPVRDKDAAWPQWPVHNDSEKTAVLDVLESGEWFYGPRVEKFEKEYAAFQGAAHGVSCTSGTTALEIVFQALGIGPGDEVIVPPYTFIATASAVMRVGANPIFADIDDTWCMDPKAVEACITDKTKAVVPVHFGGRISDVDALRALAEANGLPLVEDACHSWGAQLEGAGTGTLGLCGVFSFQQSKNITAGEGGIIISNDAEFAAHCRSLTNCGRAEGGVWYHHINVGTNARMTEIQAAILSAQLERLEEQTLLRDKNGRWLDSQLNAIDGITVQRRSDRVNRRAYHLYCLQIDEAAFGCSREQMIKAAEAEGLEISAGYPLPLYDQPAIIEWYKNHDLPIPACPVVEDICQKSGAWMLHTVLLGSDEDMQDIVSIFQKIKAQAGELS